MFLCVSNILPSYIRYPVSQSYPEQADTSRKMDQEQQLREDEIKAVISQDLKVCVRDYIFQARESLTVEKLKEYEEIFSFFDKYVFQHLDLFLANLILKRVSFYTLLMSCMSNFWVM